MWVVAREMLTEDQLSAVLMSRAKHRVVVGGPGSGKTLVLAHRAQQFLSAGIPPDRLRILVYTKVLAEYLDEGLVDLGLPNDIVTTFDSWCLGLFDTIVRGKRPKDPGDPKGHRVDFEAVRAAVLAKVLANQSPPIFDAVLVDEGQDLTPTAVRLLAAVSKHVTLALDSRQQLYATGMDVETACDILGVQKAAATLLSAYRCTQLIVDVASQFLPDEEASTFRVANLMQMDGAETPVLFRTPGTDEEMNELAALVGERAMLGQTTAVLVPTRREEYKVIKALSERQVKVATRTDLSFGDLRPIVLTYHSAKGLTVDAVFLPGLTEKAFKTVESPGQRNRMIFVGITRATRWAWLGVREDDRLSELDCLAPLIRRKALKELPDGRFMSASRSSLPSERSILRAAAKKAAVRPAKKAARKSEVATAKKTGPAPLNIADLL